MESRDNCDWLRQAPSDRAVFFEQARTRWRNRSKSVASGVRQKLKDVKATGI
jgi:hypothetical protein